MTSLQLFVEWGISLKLDTHGIRFRLWLAFFTMAIGITLFIAVLQTGLIRPYYRNSKIAAVRTVETISNKHLLQIMQVAMVLSLRFVKL